MTICEESLTKRDANKTWANCVNADEKVNATWRCLLGSETDISQAKGSLKALKGLGEAKG